MSADRERLLHDVAKYVARTAVNLPPGEPISPPLAGLLLRDVYGRGDEPRMSVLFDRLARGERDPELARCRDQLVAIDELEERARAGDEEALAAIADGARRVAERLRAWARRERS